MFLSTAWKYLHVYYSVFFYIFVSFFAIFSGKKCGSLGKNTIFNWDKCLIWNEFTGDIDTITERTEKGDYSPEKAEKGDKSEIDGDVDSTDTRSLTTVNSADRCKTINLEFPSKCSQRVWIPHFIYDHSFYVEM